MQTSDWVLIFTALFLGGCALFVPYFAEFLKRGAYKPKLKITFRQAAPHCHMTYWRSPLGSEPSIMEPVYYFRFAVVNEGKSQARQCEAVLENLWIYDSSEKPKPYINFTPVIMTWAGTQEPYININPNRFFYCDIGHISSEKYQKEVEYNKFIDISGYVGNESRFMLDLHQIFFSQPNCLVPRNYLIKVGIFSENTEYVTTYFKIFWSGKWYENEVDLYREIVIEEIKDPFH